PGRSRAPPAHTMLAPMRGHGQGFCERKKIGMLKNILCLSTFQLLPFPADGTEGAPDGGTDGPIGGWPASMRDMLSAKAAAPGFMASTMAVGIKMVAPRSLVVS